MQHFLKLTYCLMMMGLTSYCHAQQAQVQVVTLGQGDPVLCNTYYYKVSNPGLAQADAVITGYKFTTPFGGSQYGNQSFYTSNQIGIMWTLPNIQQFSPSNYKNRVYVQVACEVGYKYPKKNSDGSNQVDANGYIIYNTGTVSAVPLNLYVKGVPPISISGPVNIDKCSQPSISYTSSGGYTDADRYVWTVPVGWTVTGPSTTGISTGQNFYTNTNSIIVQPNATTAGRVTCAAHMSALEGLGSNCYYEQTNYIDVNRPNPSIAISTSNAYLCHNGTITASISGSTANLSQVNWVLPVGCSIVGNPAQPRTTITIAANTTATTGNITASATYSGGCTSNVAAKTQTIYNLNPPPTVPDGALGATVLSSSTSGTACYSQVAFSYNPWNSTPFTNGTVTVSPSQYLFRNNRIINVRITFTNVCTGATSVGVFEEQGPECDPFRTANNTENIDAENQFVNSEERLLPNISNNSTIAEKTFEPATITLAPNPTHCELTINLPCNNALWQLRVYDTTGKIVAAQTTSACSTTFNLSDAANGLYILEASNHDTVSRHKIVVSH